MSDLSRRSLITGLISLIAAPAIVRVSSLMPVKALKPDYQVPPVYFQGRLFWVTKDQPQTIQWGMQNVFQRFDAVQAKWINA
jgi:hypothetical protein